MNNIVERLRDSLDYEFNLSFKERKELLSYIEEKDKQLRIISKIIDHYDYFIPHSGIIELKNILEGEKIE